MLRGPTLIRTPDVFSHADATSSHGILFHDEMNPISSFYTTRQNTSAASALRSLQQARNKARALTRGSPNGSSTSLERASQISSVCRAVLGGSLNGSSTSLERTSQISSVSCRAGHRGSSSSNGSSTSLERPIKGLCDRCDLVSRSTRCGGCATSDRYTDRPAVGPRWKWCRTTEK